MPVTSVYYTILQAVQTAIQALNLSGTTPLPTVAIRKLPTAQEGIDRLPLICVVPSDEPEDIEHASFEQLVNVVYPIEVVIVAPGNRDFITNLDQWLSWREKIRRQFQDPVVVSQAATTIWMTHVDMEVPLDRGAINEEYDYSGMVLHLTSLEQRNN